MKPLFRRHHVRSEPSAGFTLLEILIVLGIIGALATVILPQLTIMSTSQASQALREFASHARATYDNAVLEGRTHRLVIDMKKGEYWSEQAPPMFDLRSPTGSAKDTEGKLQDEESRAKWLEELNEVAVEAEGRSSERDEKRKYGARSILMVRRKIFTPVKWTEIDDQVLFHRNLPTNVVFASAQTEAMEEPLTLEQSREGGTVHIYFFPTGMNERAVVHIGFLNGDNTVAEKPRYTLKLDAASGKSEIVPDFEEADFRASEKQ